MRGVFSNLIGKRFGRLVVNDGPLKRDGRQGAFWGCVCDCGGSPKAPIGTPQLLSGVTKSCGCLKVERIKSSNTTHGMTKSPEYIAWRLMWQRCTNPSHKSYEAYKGFVPVERWKSFEAFYMDMGDRPKGLTLDRIDNTKGYSPENCRWADAYTQQGNTKRNIYLELDGEKMCLKAACRKIGSSYTIAKARVRNGWDPYEAATAPIARGPRKGYLRPDGVFVKE